MRRHLFGWKLFGVTPPIDLQEEVKQALMWVVVQVIIPGFRVSM